ncbi:dockerin type I domain-containing protein [Singulisphaera sp. Ch08]|uniref:Dockerin type I domain-containing protein n=1 Tax=Singulisphaera sp. Ch08 TaxID=3120278 RepID=A0AAU7CBJ8_9BACT
MLRSPHSHPRRRRTPAYPTLDRLEPRTLLSTVPGFANFEGRISGPAGDPIAVQVNPSDFDTAPGGRVLLRVEARAANGSRLDPGATALESAIPGGVRILSRRADVPRGTASVTIASVLPGALTIRPRAEGRTTGDYTLSVSLAGDTNGDNRVDRFDLSAIRQALGRRAGASGIAPGADVDGDGRVSLVDLGITARNFGASTRIRPLTTRVGLDPAADPDGDGKVNKATVDVAGQTAPGVIVRLDRGADGSFEATTTSGPDGRYRFTVPLNLGANPIAVVATDTFGQTARDQVVVTRVGAVETVTASFDFTQGDQGWESGFADLPANPNASYELQAGLRPLPPSLGVNGTGYLLQSHNRSDDVFMYLKRKLDVTDGIVPNQVYSVKFQITLASNAPSGSFGVGGAPGEAVVLKAGAGPVEPRGVANNGFVRLNVDIGDQSTGGPGASAVGHIANGETENGTDPVPYVSLTKQHTHTFAAKADNDGNLWLLVGTDSGFEGLTALYYQEIKVQVSPLVA